MNTPQEPGRRIVSKGKFAANIGKIVAWSSAAIAAFLIYMLFTTIFMYGVSFYGDEWGFKKVIMVVVGCGISLYLLYFSIRAARQAKKVKVGVPLTRANTADLPAPESLVRASAEPVQDRQAVLLRAAV
jgi:hypothetical protein